MKLIYLKSALKCDSFDVSIGIKIPFFRVLVTIEPGRSLLQFMGRGTSHEHHMGGATVRYHELFDTLLIVSISCLVFSLVKFGFSVNATFKFGNLSSLI